MLIIAGRLTGSRLRHLAGTAMTQSWRVPPVGVCSEHPGIQVVLEGSQIWTSSHAESIFLKGWIRWCLCDLLLDWLTPCPDTPVLTSARRQKHRRNLILQMRAESMKEKKKKCLEWLRFHLESLKTQLEPSLFPHVSLSQEGTLDVLASGQADRPYAAQYLWVISHLGDDCPLVRIFLFLIKWVNTHLS